MDQHRQLRREARRLLLPVADDRRRSRSAARAHGRRRAPIRAGSGRASEPSCPGPCRRPGRRPGPSGAGTPATSSRAPGTAASVPWNPVGRQLLERRAAFQLGQEVGDPARRRERPRTSRPPLTGFALRAIWTTSRKRILRFACFFQKSRAAWISSALNCTHWPRILDQRRLEPGEVLAAPSASAGYRPARPPSRSEGASSSDRPLPPCIFGLFTDARAASRSLVPLPVHHAGSSTPKPACSKQPRLLGQELVGAGGVQVIAARCERSSGWLRCAGTGRWPDRAQRADTP